MAQLYHARQIPPNEWLLSGPETGSQIELNAAATIAYATGGSDTLPAYTPAVLADGTSTFDRSTDVYVPYVVKGDPTLRLIKESLLPALTDDYAPLARVELHSVKPYQPEPYLSAGGLGGSVSSVQTVVSALPAKVLDLWTGSANAAQPAGWHDEVFDDSAWGGAVIFSVPGGEEGPLAGSNALAVSTAPTQPDQADFLFRQTFSLPAGVITGATFTFRANDLQEGAWLNGTSLGSELTPSGGSDLGPDLSASPSPSLLHAGAQNTIAVWVRNAAPGGPPSPSWASYTLVVTYTGSGAAGGTEGDLLYFHAGAWADLHIGASGDVLTSDGTDPAWATPGGGSGLGTVTSVQVAVPSPLSAAGGPITSSGTITLSWSGGQTANRVLASPNGSSGAVSLRALVGNDIPVDASTIVSSAGTIKGNYQAGSGISISGNTISATGGSGTVTSVALTVPGIFSLAGSPIVSSGTLAISLASQTPATVFAAPASGSAAAPTFRALQGSDLPAGATAGGNTHAHSHFH